MIKINKKDHDLQNKEELTFHCSFYAKFKA